MAAMRRRRTELERILLTSKADTLFSDRINKSFFSRLCPIGPTWHVYDCDVTTRDEISIIRPYLRSNTSHQHQSIL